MSELTFYGLVADLEKLQAAQEHIQVQLMKLARTSPGLKRDARFQEIEEQGKASLLRYEQIISEYRQRNQATEQAEPLSEVERYNRAIDERNRIIAESRDKPWLPLHDGE